METVGIYLKKERELKNISLRELSRLSKISMLYLDCIERDEFEKLPQGPYIKGYISSYSRLIGGNVDEAINLYESLKQKEAQTDEIRTEISNNDHRKNLPARPQTNERGSSNTSLAETTISSFSTVASYLKAKSASLQAAGTSIKNIGSSKAKEGNLTERIILIFRKITASWTVSHALILLSGTGMLVLAGFGFYHLFIYDRTPLPVVQLQELRGSETPPREAIDSEKSVSPSKLSETPLKTDQPKAHANNKQPIEDQKRSLSSSTNPVPASPRTKLKPENSADTSKPAIHAGTLIADSPSTAENSASNRTTAGKENGVQSVQRQMQTGPSPEPTIAHAHPNVLQASVCSEIKNRMPSGVDMSFPVSTQRVYVWNRIEAQQIPSTIRHVYYFKGQKRSEVTLDVRSTYWRTWSSKDISDYRYQGEWRVDITSAEGKVLRRLYFEVK